MSSMTGGAPCGGREKKKMAFITAPSAKNPALQVRHLVAKGCNSLQECLWHLSKSTYTEI